MSENHASRHFAPEFPVSPETKLYNIATNENAGTVGEALKRGSAAAMDYLATTQTLQNTELTAHIPRQLQPPISLACGTELKTIQ